MLQNEIVQRDVDTIFTLPKINENGLLNTTRAYTELIQQIIVQLEETSDIDGALKNVVTNTKIDEKVKAIIFGAVEQILDGKKDVSTEVADLLKTLLQRETLVLEFNMYLEYYKDMILRNDTNVLQNFGTKAGEYFLKTVSSKKIEEVTPQDLIDGEELLKELKAEIKLQLNRTRIRQLQKTFDFIQQQEFEGVKGVYVIDSGKPGPTLGIGIQTHGNEPVGLAVCKYFHEHEAQIQKKMQDGGGGKIVFTCNDIKATDAYFKTGFAYHEVRKTRFADVNMNRLPLDVLTSERKDYEIQRVQELLPIIGQFDYGIDVHTSLVPGAYIVIEDSHSEAVLCRDFPITTYVQNIIKLFKGEKYLAIFDFFGGKKKIPRIIIEAGQHENAEDFSLALECCFQVCQNIGMFQKSGETPTIEKENVKYVAIPNSLVYFPSLDYEVIREFRMYEYIEKGTPIAIYPKTGEVIEAPVSGYLFMGFPKGFKPKAIDQEVFSFVEKISK